MKEIILIKYGEIILKGLNRHIFEDRLVNNIIKVVGEKARVYKSRATIYAEPASPEYNDEIVDKVSRVFGVVSVNRAAVCEKSLESILEIAKDYLKDELSSVSTFKVETKRADKTFPLKSPDVSREIGGGILAAFRNLSVNVKTPDTIVNVEIRESAAYVYSKKIAGVGGMPTGSSSKAMLLLSGGIDSPVAGYMMAKRGLELVGIHFASPPYTSLRSEEKVHDLLSKVARYSGRIWLHTVPFTEIQEQIREKCPEEFFTIIMRRFMMRLSNMLAANTDCHALITGESVAQVASQTTLALGCTDAVAEYPVFRPCIGMDKEEIITISRKIDTFNISIQPFEDCCTVFTPRHPKTRPQLPDIIEAEKVLDIEGLCQRAYEGIKRISITADGVE